ncbi:hypothetical protein DL771_006812 [Monosporascus sp. 5C6A]|nr:hypothetical protein DL771_006812 [Monosporascus sp. 5C6A]
MSTSASSPVYTLPTVAEVKEGVGPYPLSRDFVDFNRAQSSTSPLERYLGYTLSPKIPRDKKFLKLDQVTEMELVGLDVDINQVGPKEWLPNNLSMRERSVFRRCTRGSWGTFDIVNVRLIGFVIEGDPAPVLRNLTKLLKAGGYLQWRLKETFEVEGLQDVAADWQTGKRHTALAMHWYKPHIHMVVSEKIRTTNAEKAAHIDALIQGSIIETHKGAMFAHTRVIVTGKKPEA